jgi:outer membrane immunogenic protein
LGFEADIQGSGERGSNAFADPFSTTVCTNGTCDVTGPLNATAVTAYDAKISWFGTARVRLGVLVTDQILLYGTGGLAYGRVELSGVTNVNGSVTTNGGSNLPPVVPLIPGANAFSESGTNTGFAVGGGIEGKCSYWLPAGWTWKAEYLYVDLGSLDTVAPFPGGSSPFATIFLTSPFTGAITTHTRFTDNIVRVGLNYKFGYAAAPAVYK